MKHLKGKRVLNAKLNLPVVPRRQIPQTVKTSPEVTRHTIFRHSLLFKDTVKEMRCASITFLFLAQSIFNTCDTFGECEIIILVIILLICKITYFVLQFLKNDFDNIKEKIYYAKPIMHDFCNCCYKKVWVHSTIETIYISVFLQINTILNKGLILTFLIQRSPMLSGWTKQRVNQNLGNLYCLSEQVAGTNGCIFLGPHKQPCSAPRSESCSPSGAPARAIAQLGGGQDTSKMHKSSEFLS